MLIAEISILRFKIFPRSLKIYSTTKTNLNIYLNLLTLVNIILPIYISLSQTISLSLIQ